MRALMLMLVAVALMAAGRVHAQSCSAIVAGPASFTGIVNTYYPGNGTAGAGSTSISIGTSTGAGVPIASGDLLIVIQMQDAAINSSNTSSYGGSGGGQGQTNINNTGLYEYAVATNAVGVGGGTVTVASGLLNTYRTSAANSVDGQKTFQVVRVPQASSATVTGDLQASAWNGSSGGIIAIDVAGNLTWGGRTLDVAGRGFRGGGGQCSIGAGGTWSDQDYRTAVVTLNLAGLGTTPNGSKGEGVAGTPILVFTPTTIGSNAAGTSTNTGGTDGSSGGYPNGSFGRGAPGNGGGGGTDGNPPVNDENTGGAGGGNYGIGGKGGYGWTPNTPPGDDTGGFGGMAMPNSATRLFMGGGGGAGSTNNCTGTPAFGMASSGAAGGGMVFVRAGTTTGSASIAAFGTNANSTVTNDASGGGGAGGTVLVFVDNNGAAVNASINVSGGNGGSNTGGGSPHGPGGGGSGGFAIVSGPATVTVSGGVNGTTATSPTSTAEYGSSPSVGGFQIVNLGAADIPGAGSARACFPQLTVSKTTSTPFAAVGAPATYTITVSNLAGRSSATGVTLGDPLTNANITYASTSLVALLGGSTRPTTTNPTIGSNSPAWSSFTIPGGGSVALTFVASTTAALPPGVYQNPANVTYLDPTRTAAQTVTPGGTYTAGAGLGTVPGSNYASGSSTNEDVTFVSPPVFTKTFNPTAITVGAPTVLTVSVTNPGGTALTSAGFTDTYPSGVVNTASPGATSSCGGSVAATPNGTGFTLAGGSIPAGGSCTVTVNVTMTSPGPYTNTIVAGALLDTQNVTNPNPGSGTIFTNIRVVKSFAPNAVAPNSDSTLSLQIVNDNTSPMNLANPGLTDVFPAGLVATGGAITVTGAGCSGFLPAAVGANATAVVLTAGLLPAASTCTVSFAVRSATTGIYANTTSGVTTTQSGTTGPVSNTANLGVGVINLAKAFSPASIVSGGTSTVTLTLTNPTGVAQTGGNLTDTLVGMSISGAQNTAGTCAPVTALANGQTALSFSGLNVPIAGCTITFVVTSNSVGAQSNTTGGVATALLPRGPASNTAPLNVLGRPSIAKAFAPTTINAGGISTLTFTITNASPVPLTGAAFTDAYPANLFNATPLTVGGSCTGVTTTATAGGNSFNLTGAALPASSSCTITVAVTSSVTGVYNNATTTGVATTQTGAALGGSQSNTATLNVAATPTIVKSFGTSPIAQGGTSTMQFVVTNSNPGVALTNVRFTDNLVGMTVAAATFGGSCGASNSPTLSVGATALDITIPTIAAGGNCTITVTVTSNASGSWPNTTSGATSTQTPVMGATSNTATLVVLSPPMLTKAFSPSFVQTGVASTITFTITNPQATALTNVAFTDTLVNMAVASAQATGGSCGVITALVAGQTNLSYTVPTLAASASCTITLTVNSSTVSPAGGHPNTTSTITSTQTPTNGGAPATAYLNVLAAPTITKAFSPNSVTGLTPSTITFTLTNPNAITLTNVRFTDTFPANMRTPNVAQNYIGAGRGTCVGAIPSAQGAVNVTALSFAAITMPANSSCTITVDIELTANGAYTNTTSGVTTNQTTVGTGSSATISRGRIGVTKAFAPATVQVGGTSTMTFTLLNNSGGTVNNITLTDTFPAGMVATGGAVTEVGVCTNLAPNTIAANATTYAMTDLDNLTNGSTCTISMSVTGTTAGVKSNTVTGVSPAAIAGVASTADLTVYAPPTIAKAFAPATIAAGGNSTITFTLTNPNTFATLANASFTDTLVNMTVNNTVVGGTCVGTTPSALTIGATALAFSGINLPASGVCTVTVVITSATIGTRPNTVSGVTTTQTPTAGTGNGPVNLTVAGLNITKSFTPASRPVGVPTTLSFVITSPSAVAWSNIAFTDTLPANLVIASPSNASTSCASGVVAATSGTNAVSLSGGTMASGASPCVVNVDVVSALAGTYNNAAANFSGLSPGASYTGGTVSVVYFAASTVTKAFSPTSIAPGGTSTLTFTITNPAGAQAVTGLNFTDTLPANVVVAATPAAANTCGATFAPAAGSNVLTLTGGSRPAGPSSCTATVNVTSLVIGAYNNSTVNFSNLGGGLTANTAIATLNVVGTALTKAFNPSSIGRGGVSTLTFTINNGPGNPAQAGLAFLETLPTNVFVAGAPTIVNGCGGTVTAPASGSTIQLAGGSLAAAAASCTFSVNVTSAIAGSYFNGPTNITGEPASMDASGVNATLVTNDNPGVAKSFTPAAVGLNTNSVLTITLSNANSIAITGAAFTDTYPASVVNAPAPAGATTCGGTVTAAAGGNTLVLAGGTIPANGSCTVTVNVRSAVAGSYTNTLPIGAVSSTNAGVSSTAPSAVLNVLAPITVTKAYAPNPVVAGSPTTLTITLANPNAFAAVTGAAFTDTNPAGVLNTATPAGATTCGGTVTAAASGTSVALAGGTVAAAGSCTVTVQQAAAAAGAYANVIAIGDVTTTNAGSNAAAANATLNTFIAPTFTKAFTPAAIGPGGTSTLTFTINNPAGNPQALTGVAFNDTFPVAPGAMVVAAAPTPVLTGCGAATFTPVAGAASIAFSGGTVAVGGSCTVSVNVTATATGGYNNTSGTVTTTGPVALTGTTASATLTIAQPTLTKAFAPTTITIGGTPSTLTFTLTNAAGNPAQSGIAFTDTLPAGLVVATPNGLANTCPAGTVTAVAGSNSIALAGGTMNLAQASCTISINVTTSATPTAGTCPQASNTNAVANITGATRITNNVGSQCLTVVAAVPTLNKAFSGVLVVGSTVNLTFTVSQPATNPTQAFSFTDTLPAGLVLAAGGASGTCAGGTVTATAGSSAITVAGRQVTGASCTIIVPVTTSGTPTAGVCPVANNTNGNANITGITNIVAAITNSAAGGSSSTTGACVSVTSRPTVAKAYSPNPAAAGAPVTLTITLSNTNAFGVTGAGFIDTNPVGVLNTATPAGTTTCGGTATAAASGTSVALAGGTIPANGSCTVTVQQSAAAPGSFLNTIAAGDLTTTNGGSNINPATSTLVVEQATLTKAFAPASLTVGGAASTLTFTITNGPSNLAQSGIAFTDTLPAGLVVATPNGVASTCPAGTVTAVAGSSSIALSGGAMNAAQASCTISVNIAPSATPTIGACPQANNTNAAANITGATRITNGVTSQCVGVTAAVPSVNKAFSGVLVVGSTVNLTFTVTQPASNPTQAFSFTDTLPAGLVVAAGGASGTCAGGTVTAIAGSSAITVAGRQVSGASCTIIVPVTTSGTPTASVCPAANNTNGNANISATTNIVAAITNSAAGGGSSTTGACVSITARPTVTKAYSPNPAAAGATVTLTITLANTNTFALTGAAFTDTNPVGVLNTAAPAGSTTCGGTVTAAASGASVALAGGTIPAGGTCIVTVLQAAANAGSYLNTIAAGDVTTANGGSNATAATSTLVVEQPTLTKAFSPTSVVVAGTPTTLTFTLTNSAGNPAQSGIAFTDTLPSGLMVATPNGAATSCPAGTVAAAAGSNTIAISGATMTAALASCTFSVNVVPSATPTAGACPQANNTNAAANITGANHLNNGVTAQCVNVNSAQPILDKAFSGALVVGQAVSLTFTISQPAANPTQVFSFTDTLPAGLVVAAGGASGTCTGGTVTATAGSSAITVAGRQVSGASCTIIVPVTTSGTPSASSCPAANNTNGNTNITGTTNVTAAITNSAAGGGISSTGACVSVIARPTVAKAYSPNPAAAGAPVTLTITLSNANSIAITGAAFTDTNPAGVLNTTTPAGSTTCGGTVTAAASGSSVALAGGTIPANGSCVVTVQQSAATAGSFLNTIAAGDVTTTNGGSNTAPASSTLVTLAAPTFTKAFTPATIGPNGTSTLTFTITNPAANTQSLTGVVFSDTFPTTPGAMVVAGTPAPTTTGCGAPTFTPVAGAASIAFSGGTIAVGGTCSVTVDVTAPIAGTYNNTSSTVTTTGPATITGTTASATLTVAQPTLTKAFAPASVTIGGAPSTLTFTLTNAAGNPAQSGIAFTDTLPAGLVVATPSGAASACPAGTVIAAAGGNSIVFSGGTLNVAQASCNVSVNVVPSSTPTAGACPQANNTNAAANITGAANVTNGVTAQCLVVNAAVPTLNKVFSAPLVVGSTVNLTFTASQPATNPTQAFSFTDTLPAGLVVAAGGATGTCTGGTVTATAGSNTITVAGRQVTGASCTIIVPVTTSGTPTAAQCPSANNTNGNTNISATTNITAAIQNSNAGGAASITGACVSVTARPTLTKAYSPNPAAAGSAVTLTITLSNSNSVALAGAAFNDTNPAGVLNTAAPAGATTCGGTVTAAANGSSVALVGGTIPAAGSCTVTAQQTAAVAGSYLNTIAVGDLTTTNGGSNATAANATLVTLASPTIAKAFGPAIIGPGGTTTQTFTLTNPASNTQALTGVAFNDTFPTTPGAMVVAATPAATTSGCGAATFSPVAGAATIAFSNGTLAVGGTCTVTVNVTAPVAGTYNNTSGALSATGPVALTGNTASASLTVAQALLTKAFTPSTIDQDGVSTLVFTLANGAGNPAQSGIAFTDTLPAGLVINTPNGVASTCPSGTVGITATAGGTSIAVAGASMTLAQASCTISVAVTTPAPGVYTNTDAGNITGAQRITTTGVNATLTVQVLPTLTKAFGAATVALGGTTTLTFTINNTAPSAVNRTGITFTDTLPAGISLANPPLPTTNGNCGAPAYIAANNTQPFTASAVDVAAGQTCTITIGVRGVAAGTAINGSGNVNSTGAANTVTNQPITVVGAPAIAKAFGPATINADGTSTITFTITNPSATVALTGAGFTDTLTAMAIATPGGAAGGSCVGAASNTFTTGTANLAFTGLTVPATGSCTVTVVITSDLPGAHNNTTTGVSSNEAPTGAASNTAVLTVTAGVPTIAKAFAPATIAIGTNSTITFTLANPNGSPLTAGAFTDTLSGMTIAATAAAGGTCVGAASNNFTAGATALSFTGLTLPANASCTVTVVVTSAIPGPHNNQTSGVSSAEAATGPVSNIAVLTATAVAPTIAKAFAAPIASGGVTTLTITISNTNAAPLTVTSVTDNFPATPGSGMLRAATPAPGTTCVGGTVSSSAASVTLTGGTVPANGSCIFQIDVTAASTGSYVNTIPVGALITSVGSNTAAATDTLTVSALANLGINKSAPATIATGATITYTITVTNAGPDAANNALFADNVPAAITGVGASCLGTVGATCAAPTVTGNSVTGAIAVLPAGGVATYTITGTATGAAAISNTATVTSPPGVSDPTPGNNTSTANTIVQAADLTITKSHVGTFFVGTNGTYTMVVSNGGSLATSGTVTVSDPLPTGLGFVSATGPGWICGFAGGTVSCASAAAIAAGGSGTPITLVVAVGSVAVPQVNNIATVSGGGEPPSLANNNVGSDNTIVTAAATNRFAPSGAQTALPGTVVFYPHTFNAGITGSVLFSTAAVITPASAGWLQLVYRDTNCDGALNGAEGTTPLTTAVAVTAGDTVCIVVRDSVPIYAPYNSMAAITVTATFDGTETYVVQDVTTVGAIGGAGLTLAKSVRNVTQGTAATTSGSARPDDILEYTITYTNAASGLLSSIVVTDATPAFTTFLSAACPVPPANLTGCTVTSSPSAGGVGSVVWTLAGSLLANGVGTVTYQVKVVP